MNKFERLFFILEKNDNFPGGTGTEPGGIIKTTVTEEKIKIFTEVSNLPVNNEITYEVAVFFKGYESPIFLKIKNCERNIREEFVMPYDGVAIIGVAFVYKNKSGNGIRKFPLVAYKIKQDEWKRILNNTVTEENKKNRQPPNEQDVPKEKPETDIRENREVKYIAEAKNEEPVQKEDKLELFNKSFITYDPFETTNKSYKWWRGSDMHQTNRVLIDAEIKLPFELNKEGYLACEIYGHVLLGLYKDKLLEREFFILGIPAKEKSGAGNYYSNSRWEESVIAQSTGENGYWLTYIDYETSKVVKVI